MYARFHKDRTNNNNKKTFSESVTVSSKKIDIHFAFHNFYALCLLQYFIRKKLIVFYYIKHVCDEIIVISFERSILALMMLILGTKKFALL